MKQINDMFWNKLFQDNLNSGRYHDIMNVVDKEELRRPLYFIYTQFEGLLQLEINNHGQ